MPRTPVSNSRLNRSELITHILIKDHLYTIHMHPLDRPRPLRKPLPHITGNPAAQLQKDILAKVKLQNQQTTSRRQALSGNNRKGNGQKNGSFLDQFVANIKKSATTRNNFQQHKRQMQGQMLRSRETEGREGREEQERKSSRNQNRD